MAKTKKTKKTSAFEKAKNFHCIPTYIIEVGGEHMASADTDEELKSELNEVIEGIDADFPNVISVHKLMKIYTVKPQTVSEVK